MEAFFESPLTSVSTGQGGLGGSWLPSMRACFGWVGSSRSAWLMAWRVARRMLRRSTSAGATMTMLYSAYSVMRRKRVSRCSAVSFFESLRPWGLKFWGRRTAATTRGPAIGPRPASSTPAVWESNGRGVVGLILGRYLGGGPWGLVGLDIIGFRVASIAQLVRAPDCDSGGRRFKPGYSPHMSILGSKCQRLVPVSSTHRVPQ